jgi:hypothetical protein
MVHLNSFFDATNAHDFNTLTTSNDPRLRYTPFNGSHPVIKPRFNLVMLVLGFGFGFGFGLPRGKPSDKPKPIYSTPTTQKVGWLWQNRPDRECHTSFDAFIECKTLLAHKAYVLIPNELV